jgi:periplasmic divalent cation tolerance protein
MKRNGTCAVYITAPHLIEARKLVSRLLGKRLAACANVFRIDSSYWWRGKICRNPEYAIIMKTKKALVKELVREVRKMHSYEVPCVVAWDITDGNPEFLNWVAEETK